MLRGEQVAWQPYPIGILCGSSQTVWTDLAQAELLAPKHEKIGINFFPVHYRDNVTHWVTVHSDKMRYWLPLRQYYNNSKAWTHSYMDDASIDIVWDIRYDSGTSSLYALQIALKMGYQKILLCGITLDEQPCFYDPPTHTYKHAQRERTAWKQLPDDMKSKVRSFSGFTKDLLGTPTQEWLSALPQTTR